MYQLFLGEIRYTPLLMAAKASAKKEESSFDDIGMDDEEEKTEPAAENANEIIRFLIKSGANISAVGNDG